jgi:hypothetical protein
LNIGSSVIGILLYFTKRLIGYRDKRPTKSQNLSRSENAKNPLIAAHDCGDG